jgi:hypothetical protein
LDPLRYASSDLGALRILLDSNPGYRIDDRRIAALSRNFAIAEVDRGVPAAVFRAGQDNAGREEVQEPRQRER